MLSQKPLTPAIEESRRATGNVFLDNYVLDFLDVPETVSERDLQKSIIRNLKDLICCSTTEDFPALWRLN